MSTRVPLSCGWGLDELGRHKGFVSEKLILRHARLVEINLKLFWLRRIAPITSSSIVFTHIFLSRICIPKSPQGAVPITDMPIDPSMVHYPSSNVSQTSANCLRVVRDALAIPPAPRPSRKPHILVFRIIGYACFSSLADLLPAPKEEQSQNAMWED